MIRYLLNLLYSIFDVSKDPVFSCEVYKNKGCSHIDGPLCCMKTCKTRINHSKK